jgi:AcrR family transcriptional regulator
MEASTFRKGRADYLLMGLEVLATDGPRALTSARMAREFGVTTGSFYWHFSTVDAFRDELKLFWRDEIVVGIIAEAKEQAEEPEKVLETIGQIVRRRGTYRYDRAMRSWAESDRKALKIVKAADDLRGKLIKELLQEAGERGETATVKTSLLGAAWIGSQDMKDPDYRFRMLGVIQGDQDAST